MAIKQPITETQEFQEIDVFEEDTAQYSDSFESDDSVNIDKFSIQWSSNYKKACRIMYDNKSVQKNLASAEKLLITETESGNILALHDLGKLYSTEKLGDFMVFLYGCGTGYFKGDNPNSMRCKDLLMILDIMFTPTVICIIISIFHIRLRPGMSLNR